MKTNSAAKLLALVALIGAAGSAVATSLDPVIVNDRWGFIESSAKYAINRQFDEAASFAEGRARVKVARRTGYVDATCKYVWNPTNCVFQ